MLAREKDSLSQDIKKYCDDPENRWKTIDQIHEEFGLFPSTGTRKLIAGAIGRRAFNNRDVTPRKGKDLDTESLMAQVQFAYDKSVEEDENLDWVYWKNLVKRFPNEMTTPIKVRDTVVVPLLKAAGVETKFRTKAFITDEDLLNSAVDFFSTGAYSVQDFSEFSKKKYGRDRRLSFSNRWGLGNWMTAKRRLFAIKDTGEDPGIPGIYKI